METCLCRLVEADAANLQAIVCIRGTDDQHDSKVAEAYASGLATEDQILAYVQRFGCG